MLKTGPSKALLFFFCLCRSTIAYRLPSSSITAFPPVLRTTYTASILGSQQLPFLKTKQLFMSTDAEDSVVAICTKKIEELLKPAKLIVNSSNDDPNGSHLQIECISEEFNGKNTLQRQRLVYKAIWEEMNTGAVHAVDSIVAKTPAEVGM